MPQVNEHIRPNRRRTSFIDRMNRCECCDYAVTQKHHPYGWTEFAGIEYTVSLCACCHEFYHLIEQGYTSYGSSSTLVNRLTREYPDRFTFLNNLFQRVQSQIREYRQSTRAEKTNG